MIKIKDLLKTCEYKNLYGNQDLQIEDISYDSRKTDKNHLFIAIDGVDQDGHKYIGAAIEKGARALVVSKDFERYIDLYPNLTIIEVLHARKFLAQASSAFFGNPSASLNLIGITGTKGKSTISYMIKEIFDKASKATAIIGTMGAVYGDKTKDLSATTPASYDLQKLFLDFKNAGMKTCVMEVSSIALKQDRVYGLDFSAILYTNLTQAHITPREHPTFDDYYQSKKMIFQKSPLAFVNRDDDLVMKALDEFIKEDNFKSQRKIYTIGLDSRADIYTSDIKSENHKSTFRYVGLGQNFEIEVDMPGLFNVYNALFAASLALINKIDIKYIKEALREVQVKGRCEKVETKRDFTLMIDYAHTPDSLEKLLVAVKETHNKGRIICLFGCGGDRDKYMRPLMGEISGLKADFTIITSDNSRTEDPDNIIDMIEEGIKKTKGQYIRIKDRTQAIYHGLSIAKKDDILILAGKGHETYMDVGGIKTHYDEREIVKEALERIK